jgi:hypothetical protein
MTPTPEFKSSQYEFNDEQNKTFNELSAAMGTVSTLMKLLGLVFLIFFGLQLYHAIQVNTGADAYAPAAETLLCLAIGFWTGSATHSFRRIVETKNEDIWHLMNAMESLKNMYGLLRSIILLSIVLVIVGVALFAAAMATRGG